MKKWVSLFALLLPVIALAHSPEEKDVAGGITRAAQQSAPSQQQLAEKAKVSVHVKVTKRDDFKSDFLFTEYEDTTTKKCEGVITGLSGRIMHIVVQNNCLTGNDIAVGRVSLVQVSFSGMENSLDYFPPTQGGGDVWVNQTGNGQIIMVSIPFENLPEQVREEIQGISLTDEQVDNILKNAPAPKVLDKTSKKVPGQKSFGQNFMDYFFPNGIIPK